MFSSYFEKENFTDRNPLKNALAMTWKNPLLPSLDIHPCDALKKSTIALPENISLRRPEKIHYCPPWKYILAKPWFLDVLTEHRRVRSGLRQRPQIREQHHRGRHSSRTDGNGQICQGIVTLLQRQTWPLRWDVYLDSGLKSGTRELGMQESSMFLQARFGLSSLMGLILFKIRFSFQTLYLTT